MARSVAVRAQAGGAQQPFGPVREMDSLEQTLASLSHTARLGGAAVLVAGSLGLGYVAGGKAASAASSEAVKPVARVATALALGGAATLAAGKLQEKTYDAAATELHNLCATAAANGQGPDRNAISSLAPRYGLANLTEKPQLAMELKRIYDAFLTSVLPMGDEPLRGDEPAKVTAFKSALGIDDAAAAECHLELGNRLKRQRLESGSKEAGIQELRAFQKLVFVSDQVFGEQQSKFLLPWKRVFNLTDAQLNLAKRDNASGLYTQKLESFGGVDALLDRGFLADLRETQQRLGLGDDVAAKSMQKVLRGEAEKRLAAALEVLNMRVRERDLSRAVAELDAMVQLNNAVLALAGDDTLACGLGQISLYGGKYVAAFNVPFPTLNQLNFLPPSLSLSLIR